jgi:hypothetical protein
MPGPIHAYLSADHDRVGALLERARQRGADPAQDAATWATFGEELARHIGREDRILLREVRRVDRRSLPGQARMREEHAELLALAASEPSDATLARVAELFAAHSRMEEAPGGMFELCERALASRADEVLGELRRAPPAPVRPTPGGAAPHRPQGSPSVRTRGR